MECSTACVARIYVLACYNKLNTVSFDILDSPPPQSNSSNWNDAVFLGNCNEILY